jgi:hypothetical protein
VEARACARRLVFRGRWHSSADNGQRGGEKALGKPHGRRKICAGTGVQGEAQNLAFLGWQLAEGARIDLGSDRPLRGSGPDPKLPSSQIATAGEVVWRLTRELSAAEDAELP